MSVKNNELKTKRFIVKTAKTAENEEITEVTKIWDELSPTEQKRLAYAWNNKAMTGAGYEEVTPKPPRKAIAG